MKEVVERWDLDDIAKYFRRSRSYVRDSFVKKPTFPKPVTNASPKTRFWSAQEVMRWGVKGG